MWAGHMGTAEEHETKEKIEAEFETMKEVTMNQFELIKGQKIEKENFRFKIFRNDKEIQDDEVPQEDWEYELRQESLFEVKEMVERIFECLDKDNDGILSIQEAFLLYTVHCKLLGDTALSEEEWPGMYEVFGSMYGYNTKEGISQNDVEKLLENFPLDSLQAVTQDSFKFEASCKKCGELCERCFETGDPTDCAECGKPNIQKDLHYWSCVSCGYNACADCLAKHLKETTSKSST